MTQRSLIIALILSALALCGWLAWNYLAVQEPAAAGTPSLVGEWRSTQDPKFTREFGADGSVIDRYDETPISIIGSYVVADAASTPGLPAAAQVPAGSQVITITFPRSEVQYVIVTALTDTTLALRQVLGRADSLTFTRVRTP